MGSANSWRSAFRATMPVMAGYLVLGAGYGILMHTRGYGFLWSVGMSVFVYAGSMQFVAAELLSSGASLLTAALTTALVNARHLFYGISMLDRYALAGREKPYLIFALTDETYSLVCNGEGGPKRWFRISLLDHCYWVAGTALGALAGALIPFDTTGIEFSLTALFVTVFTDQWLSADSHFPALTGVGVSAACLLLFGPDRFLLPAMGGIAALLLLGGKEAKVHG